MFQTCASVPTSGHLEALTRWRGLCGQPTNPIEEYQRGEAAASPLVCSPCSRSGAIFSQNIPIIFLCGGLMTGTKKWHHSIKNKKLRLE